jgi:hypothetical protein
VKEGVISRVGWRHTPGALEAGPVCYGGAEEGTASKTCMYSKQVKEGVMSRVGLEGRGAAEDSFANCLQDSGGVMNQSGRIKTLQDAKRSDLHSSETFSDEYGKRAERANVIKFILAVFGVRMNKKVRERREINTIMSQCS